MGNLDAEINATSDSDFDDNIEANPDSYSDDNTDTKPDSDADTHDTDGSDTTFVYGLAIRVRIPNHEIRLIFHQWLQMYHSQSIQNILLSGPSAKLLSRKKGGNWKA